MKTLSIEIIKFGETTYEFSWVEGAYSFTELVSQVNGYIFNVKNEMLIEKKRTGQSQVTILRKEKLA